MVNSKIPSVGASYFEPKIKIYTKYYDDGDETSADNLNLTAEVVRKVSSASNPTVLLSL
jgi:hypothetical protein